MRDKVTRPCPQTTTFEERGEPKRNRPEVLLLLLSLMLLSVHGIKPHTAYQGRPLLLSNVAFINPATAVHLKTTSKSIKLKTIEPLAFFVALACERIFIKTHSTESRCAIGPENILFAGASMHLSARTFYRQGQ